MPLEVELTGWSPFSPGDADNSSLPVAGIEYRFFNPGSESVDAVFTFNSQNFLADRQDPSNKRKPSDRIRSTDNGFILCGPGTEDKPWDTCHWQFGLTIQALRSIPHGCAAWIQCRSFGETLSRERATHDRSLLEDSSPGASLFVPFSVAPREAKIISLRFAWYAPKSNLFKPAQIDMDAIDVVDCNLVNCTRCRRNISAMVCRAFLQDRGGDRLLAG